MVVRNPTPPNLLRRRLGEGGSLRRGQVYGFPRTLATARQSAAAAADRAQAVSVSLGACRI